MQPELGTTVPSTERQVLDAAIALAPTISMERVLQELSQQLHRVSSCDAIAVALVDQESDEFQLALADGFDDDNAELLRARADIWRRAVDQDLVISGTTSSGLEITVPMIGTVVRGVITICMANPAPRSRLEEIERVVVTIASQAASAIERAEVVDRLAHRRRLEAIGEVSAGIAHELRNPLFGISSAAQLLRFRVRDDPVVERNVGRILREVERLNGVVSSLLEYARPAPLRVSPADPDELWRHVLAAKRGLLESKALVLRHHPASPRAACDLDSEQMSQVFVHVLANAVDAAPEGSDLAILSSTSTSGVWRCRLHNDGPPIAPEVLSRVFDLFFSTKPGAAGVGLALCQRIIEEHGGSISLESTADSGTTITMSLPPSRGGASHSATDASHG